MKLIAIPVIFSMIIPPHLLAESMTRPRIPVISAPTGSPVRAAPGTGAPKLSVNGLVYPISPDRVLFQPGANPKDLLKTRNEVNELLRAGHQSAARNICVDVAKKSGVLPANIPEIPGLKNHLNATPKEDFREKSPAIYQRNECNNNFDRDRCEKRFIASVTNENQALFGSKIIDPNGSVNEEILNNAAKDLDRKDVTLKKYGQADVLTVEDLTSKLDSDKSNPIASMVSSLFLGNKSSQPVSEIAEKLSKNSDTKGLSEVLNQPSILILTQAIVQKIDEALAHGDKEKSERLMGTLTEINPSAAKGLDCLLKQLPNGGLGDSSLVSTHHPEKIGPVSGHDYNFTSDIELKGGNFGKVLVIIGIGIEWARYKWEEYDRKAREERDANNDKLAKESAARDAQRFEWEKGDRLKGVDGKDGKESETEKSSSKPKNDPDRNTTHTDPDNPAEDERPTPPQPSITISPSPQLAFSMAQWKKHEEERKRLEKIQEGSRVNHDERQFDDFCEKVVEDLETEILKSNLPKHFMESNYSDLINDLETTKNGVIDFQQWKPEVYSPLSSVSLEKKIRIA